MGQTRVFLAYISWVSKNGSKWGKIAQTRDTGLNLELTDIQYGCQLWRCNFSLVESLTEVLVTKSKIRQISLVEYHWSLPRTKHFKTDKNYKNHFGSTFKALTTRKNDHLWLEFRVWNPYHIWDNLWFDLEWISNMTIDQSYSF